MSAATARDPAPLFEALRREGLREFAGVPCSILSAIGRAAETTSGVRYLPASVEGEAVAVCAGCWLAGGRGVALMQNSGLGNAVNPLASLALPYRIPLLLIVSWRGEPGRPDAAHHLPMGRATPGLLELLGIPLRVLREDTDLEDAAAWASRTLDETRRPAALIVPRGLFARARPGPAPAAPAAAPGGAVRRFPGSSACRRGVVIDGVLGLDAELAAIATTGFTARELAARSRSALHFPMQGSMGFALAIGLGLSRTAPSRPVFVLDGDGALIMRLGSLATVGAARPPRLVHVVLDNGAYASTGGQPSASPGVDFPEVALACGYARAATCTGRDGLEAALAWAREGLGQGPALLHVRVSAEEAEGLARPALSPEEIAAAFRAAATAGQATPARV